VTSQCYRIQQSYGPPSDASIGSASPFEVPHCRCQEQTEESPEEDVRGPVQAKEDTADCYQYRDDERRDSPRPFGVERYEKCDRESPGRMRTGEGRTAC
jgi:hypothetical protein